MLLDVQVERVYHIVRRGERLAARAAGSYEPPSLKEQGFVHCSMLDQLIETADRFYRGQDDLVLLCIDTSKLRAELRFEAPAMAGEAAGPREGRFPHLFGPLNLDAVDQVLPFSSGESHGFELPSELRQQRHADAVGRATQLSEETAQKLLRFLEESAPVRRLRASQLASGALGLVGFALLVVGIENAAQDLPVVDNAYGSIAVGLVLLFATGLLLRKLSGGE